MVYNGNDVKSESYPPAITKSASPFFIALKPVPIAWAPDIPVIQKIIIYTGYFVFN